MTRRRWADFGRRARSHAEAEQFERFLLDGGMAVVRMEDGRVAEINGPMVITQKEPEGGSSVITRD
jgi:hypothetical protein